MSNVPKLRFKEFSGEWEKIKIQKLIDNKFIIGHLDGNHGALYPKSEEFTKNGVPYVTANDFIDGKVNLKKCKCLPIERASKFKKGIAKNGDVLFAHNATVGPVALLETDFDYVILSTTATYYRCDNERLLNNYLKVYFNTNDFIEQYSRVMSQSTRNQVPITTQRLFYIQLPSKQEQEKIASFLVSVDTKIEQLTKKEALLSSYKKGVMQKIFSGEIRFKADDGSEFCDWEEKKLGEVGTTYNGLTGKTSENFGSGKPYIQYKQIFDNAQISVDGFGYVSIEPNEKQNKAQFGDIFFTTSSETPNEVAFASVLLDKIEEVYLNSFCFGYRPKSLNTLNPYFAKYLFRSANFRKEAIKLAQGSTRYNISKVELMKTVLQLPCLEEQTKIATFLSSIDSKLEQVQKQLNSTKEFKKALLQQMFV